MIKIACIDDDMKFLESLQRFMGHNPAFKCMLKAHSIGEFLENLNDDFQVDIILLDISLNNINSLDHISKIKKLLPAVKIIVMTGHGDGDYLIRALKEGANSYFLKSSPPTQLIDTIIATHQGNSFIDPKAATSLVAFFQRKEVSLTEASFSRAALQKYWVLNKREIQVAEGLFFEKTYKEIAAENSISLDTVRHYLKSLYKKMQVRNKLQLIRKIHDFSVSQI